MRRILSTAAAIMALALMVPSLGHAEVIQPDCQFDRSTPNPDPEKPPLPAPLQVGDSCSAQFDITETEQGFHVSLLGTHGSFHAVPDAGVFGDVDLKWQDADGNVVARYSCHTVSGRGDGEGTDQLRVPLCSEVTAPPAVLPLGTSTMTATVTSTTNPGGRKARLHGRILLRGDQLP